MSELVTAYKESACNECNQLTNGQCWRHGGSYEVPDLEAPTYHLTVTWANDRVERIEVTYVDGWKEVFRR